MKILHPFAAVALLPALAALAHGQAGPWTDHPITTLGDGPHDVVQADLDRDGDLDAVVALLVDDQVAWFENTGDGATWTDHVIASGIDGVTSVDVADVDGDGDPDVLSASENDGRLLWHENAAGTGLSWQVRTIASADFATEIAAVDVDGDGDVDALSGTLFNGTIRWHENLFGSGFSWATRVIGPADGPVSFAAADVDRDGDQDFFCAERFGDLVSWYENVPGTGLAWTEHGVEQSALTDGATSVFAVDLDDDGDVDAVSAAMFDDVVLWHENAAGDGSSWTTAIVASAGTGIDEPRAVFALDLDEDGDVDVLSASSQSSQVVWHEQIPDTGGPTWAHHGISGGAHAVAAGDFDGDGDPDAISVSFNPDLVVWHENTATGIAGKLCSEHGITSGANGAAALQAADLDGDGDLDAVCAAAVENRVLWYESTASDGTSWTEHVVHSPADGVTSVTTGDVDGDGDLDVLAAVEDEDRIEWYENLTGAGSSWVAHTIFVGANGAASVAAADVDGDGDLDALSASRIDGRVFWYENVFGNGPAWAPVLITAAAPGASSVCAADVDGDGDVDVLAASEGNDRITWYRNFSSGFSWQPLTIATGVAGASAVFAADVDGDGDLDALAAAADGDEVCLLYTSPSPRDLSTSRMPSSA